MTTEQSFLQQLNALPIYVPIGKPLRGAKIVLHTKAMHLAAAIQEMLGCGAKIIGIHLHESTPPPGKE